MKRHTIMRCHGQQGDRSGYSGLQLFVRDLVSLVES